MRKAAVLGASGYTGREIARLLRRHPRLALDGLFSAREGAAPEPMAGAPAAPDAEGLREMVWEILVKQLGHRPSEASQLITDALRRRPDVMSPEELFDEIYRGQAATARP